MIQKIYTTFISFAFAALTLSSCSDWLDLYPSDEIKEEYLFSSGDGFRTATNGIYRKMATFDLYGSNLTWGILDAWAQAYYIEQAPSIAGGTPMRKIAELAFKNTELVPVTDAMWKAAWNVVANCNELAQQAVQADPNLFYGLDSERQMILGEAIGLRAFVQFDLLRIYAPSPSSVGFREDNRTFIPYVNVYPSYINDHQTVNYCLEQIIADLKEAQRILEEVDKESKMNANSRFNINEVSQSQFAGSRGYRLNYYAVTAMLARVYCWAGEYGNAYKEAKEVVDATYSTGSTSTASCFNFSNSLTTNRKDYNSIIMTFFKSTCYEDYLPYMTKGNDVVLVVNTTNLFGDEAGADDRNLDLFGDWDGGDIKYSFKYDIKEGTSGTDMIPAIRLSEMYYIMGEYFAYKDEFSKAGEMLDKVRYARGISTTNLASSIGSLEVFHTHLIKEMRREFVGEGQMFFQYKRLDQKPKDNVVFVFDKPNNEDI